jgi:hypothetical protein
MAEYPVINRKGLIKSLKIRPPAIKPIDIVLRRSAGPGLYRPPLLRVMQNTGHRILSPLKKGALPAIHASLI